jgi:hypothetical protein
VIESKKLPPEENLWLKSLNTGLNAEATGIILDESRKKGKEAETNAYLYAVLQASAEKLEEVVEMRKDGKITLDEVLEEAGLTAKWEARGEARGEKSARKVTADDLVFPRKRSY